MSRPVPQRKDTQAPLGQDYEFYPLTGINPIRLLHLTPGPVTGTFQYKLIPVDLSSSPPPVFKCLSYTWAYPQWEKLNPDPNFDISHTGDRNKSIKCDGKSIMITDNLKSALERLWDEMSSFDSETGSRIPFWIDLLCIHQESNEERSAQVTKMDEIYRHAKKVIVWLGPEDKIYTTTSIEVLSQLSNVKEENRTADIPGGLKHPEIFTKLRIQPIYDFEWQALGDLLLRTWFSRLWVIQELFEANEVVVYCGKHVLDWWKIVDVSELLNVTGLGRALMEYLDRLTSSPLDEEDDFEFLENPEEEEMDGPGTVYISNTVNNQWLFQSLREQKEDLKLETLLSYARYFGAIGHHDYVYAVRGMWKPTVSSHQQLRETIKPDYKIPVEDVFTSAAYASAVEMGDLNLLCLVEDNSLRLARARKEYATRNRERDMKKKEVVSKKLPTWVPDWSITPIAETLCMNPRAKKWEKRWIASKGLPYTPPPKTIGRELCVKGVCITTIADRAGKEPSFVKDMDGIPGMEIFALLEFLSKLLARHPSMTADFVNAFCKAIIKDTYHGREANDEAKKALTSFLAVRVFEIERALSSSPFPSLGTFDLEPPTEEPALLEVRALLDTISALDRTATIPTYQTIRLIIEEGKGDIEFTGVNEEDKFFAESLRSAYVGRRLFYTAEVESKGVFLGIGPESLKNGDEVWVIAGADVPMVLRSKDEGRWSLVGECYVHGIMGGEAVVNVGKGQKGVVDVILV